MGRHARWGIGHHAGTMLFGRPVPRQEAIRQVHAALDLGVNLFDTADVYRGLRPLSGLARRGRRKRSWARRCAAGATGRTSTTKVGNPVASGHDGRPSDGTGYARTGLSPDLVEQHRRQPLCDAVGECRPTPHLGCSGSAQSPACSSLPRLCRPHDSPRVASGNASESPADDNRSGHFPLVKSGIHFGGPSRCRPGSRIPGTPTSRPPRCVMLGHQQDSDPEATTARAKLHVRGAP